MARRLILLVCSLALVAGLSGCNSGEAHERRFAETEGLYINVGELTYQIQLSRQLNPDDAEDREYLTGIPDSVFPPDDEEAWFGVFLRVENQTDEAQTPAEDFEIEDTDGETYEPVSVENPYNYEAERMAPGELYPIEGSTASQGGVRGALLLFKLPYDAFQNRPLEFKVKPAEGEEGIVDIDV